MQNSYAVHNNNSNEIETFCVLLIEKELEIFFSNCIESAYSYSSIISENLSLHNKENFEKLVISSQSIKIVLQTIIDKINSSIRNNFKYLILDQPSLDFIKDLNYHIFLMDTINNFKNTQLTTKLSEYIIDSTIPYILDEICPNTLIKKLFKKTISSKNILNKNNLENQMCRHRKLIYRQLEGFLLNMKVNLRNELTKACLLSIDDIESAYNSAFIA